MFSRSNPRIIPRWKFGRLLILLGVACLVSMSVFVVSSLISSPRSSKQSMLFDGARAMEAVYYQVNLGPRAPGSSAHSKAVSWMQAQLRRSGWSVELQKTNALDHEILNVIGRWEQNNSLGAWIILCAHYDSRLVADRDPDPAQRNKPVPGANDGASGVAILLELARSIPVRLENSSAISRIWLVFFDAEDNGHVPGWDWVLGSQAFVARLEGRPQAVILLDMVGDADLKIYQEGNSDPSLNQSIWATAGRLGYQAHFIPQVKYTLLDDHLAFVNAGIPAVDVIDFDYPYWHTTDDTPDKVSIESLQIVGDTILTWLIEYK